MDSLPPDIIYCIYQWLDRIEVGRFACTCKRVYNVLPRALRDSVPNSFLAMCHYIRTNNLAAMRRLGKFPDIDIGTIINNAVMSNRPEILKYLIIERGVDPKGAELSEAACLPDTLCLWILLDDPRTRIENDIENTALAAAAARGNLAAFNMLLADSRCEINDMNISEITDCAMHGMNIDIIKTVMENEYFDVNEAMCEISPRATFEILKLFLLHPKFTLTCDEYDNLMAFFGQNNMDAAAELLSTLGPYNSE